MSYPVFARSAVAMAIASVSFNGFAQEASNQPTDIADPIVVTATRIPTRYNKLISDVTVVDEEQIRDYSPAEPISDILANTPGITVRSNGGLGTATSVQIRGGTNAQTILLIDGLRLNSATTGAPPWAYIPMPQIGRMEVVRGPTSSSYGSDAIGGVVQLFTRKGEGPTKFYADAGYGTYNTTSQNIGVEGSQDGFSYSVYGSNTHSVSFPTYVSSYNPPGQYGYNSNPASYTNTSASGNFSYLVYPGQEIGVKALWGNGQNGFTNTKTQMATSLESLNVLSAYTKNRIVDDWTSLIRVGSSQDNSRSWYANNSQTVFNTTQKQAQWQNDLKLPVGNAMLAYEFLNQAVNSTTAYNVTSRNINTVQGGWNADIGNHLIQANLRNDDNSQFGNATTTSLGYGYFILPTVRGTASWGTGFQAPTFNQLYYPGQGGLYKGNANLQPTKSENTEVGLRYNDGVHSAGVIYYYNNITNLVNYTSNYATYTNVGRSIIQGVTTSYDGQILGLNVMGSVDYQNPQNGDTGTWLAYHPQGFGSLTVEKAVSDWKLGGQMQVQGPQQTNPGATSNVTLGGYTLFNLYGNVKLYKDVSLFARLNNIFDKQYQTIMNYSTPGSNVFVGLRFDNR